MTLIFPTSNPPEGFETNDFSAWDGVPACSPVEAVINVVATSNHHGSYSLHASVPDLSAFTQARIKKDIPDSSELYARIYVKVNSHDLKNNNDRGYFIGFVGVTDFVAWAGWKNVAGTLKWQLMARDVTNHPSDYSEASPVVGLWYCVELYWKKGNPGHAQLYVNGVKVAEINTGDMTAFGDVNSVYVGLPEAYRGIDVNIDCVAVADSYIGPEQDPQTLLQADAKALNNEDLLGAVYGYNQGKYAPTGFINLDDGYLKIKDNVSEYASYLFLVRSTDNCNEPLLVTDRGYIVKKDIQAGGFLGSSQGQLSLGSGLTSQVDYPTIKLFHSEISRLDGNSHFNISPVPGGVGGHAGVAGITYPSTPGPDQKYFLHTNDNQLYHYNDVSWDEVAQSSGMYFLDLSTKDKYGYNGSSWVQSSPVADEYFLRQDANNQYNLLLQYVSSNWIDCTSDSSNQLYRRTDLGQLWKSTSGSGTWTWASIGTIEDFAGTFDTLHLVKADGSSPAHMKLGTVNCDLIAYNDGDTQLARTGANELSIFAGDGSTYGNLKLGDLDVTANTILNGPVNFAGSTPTNGYVLTAKGAGNTPMWEALNANQITAGTIDESRLPHQYTSDMTFSNVTLVGTNLFIDNGAVRLIGSTPSGISTLTVKDADGLLANITASSLVFDHLKTSTETYIPQVGANCNIIFPLSAYTILGASEAFANPSVQMTPYPLYAVNTQYLFIDTINPKYGASTVNIGGTLTLPNNGTLSYDGINLKLNGNIIGAQGPQGPMGPTGATGPQGPAGQDGEDGVITGTYSGNLNLAGYTLWATTGNFGYLWGTQVNYHELIPYDTFDDLQVAKSYKIINMNGKNVIDVESMQHLTSSVRDGYWDGGKVQGFLLGCAKQTALKFDDTEAKFKAVLEQNDKLEQRVNALQVVVNRLAEKHGGNNYD
ncbi:MAG: collagen-like protein [Candidatus Bathyarchaeota archaeon]|nr:collagen-like protein [Candidatus Bathyarchaeota archaeon]